MEVEVRHLLVRVCAVVREDAVSRLDAAQLRRDLACRPHQGSDLLGRGLLREVLEGNVGSLGDQ